MEELFCVTLMFDAFDVLTKTLPEKLAWKIDFNRPPFTHQTPLNVVRKLLSDEFPQSWLRMAEEMSQQTKLNTNNTPPLVNLPSHRRKIFPQTASRCSQSNHAKKLRAGKMEEKLNFAINLAAISKSNMIFMIIFFCSLLL